MPCPGLIEDFHGLDNAAEEPLVFVPFFASNSLEPQQQRIVDTLLAKVTIQLRQQPERSQVGMIVHVYPGLKLLPGLGTLGTC